MLSTLDPLGMPIATEILSGEKADDPLYIPAIERVRSTLKQPGLLYIGDCKMASMGTRTHIVSGGDFYQRILVLLGFPPTIYTQLSGQSFTPE